MDLVLFGIQGSGKGTLARAIAEKYNYKYFETGGQLRQLAQEESPLAKKVKKIIEAGQLVPNEVVMEIIENFMNNIGPNDQIIFDGIPRSMEQADSFDQLLTAHNRKFTGILVDIPEEMAIKRLTSRRICKNCKAVFPANYDKNACEKCSGELVTRADDNPESIKTRLKAYNDETMPVIKKYKSQEKMLTLDGTPAIPEAKEGMFQLIEEKIL